MTERTHIPHASRPFESPMALAIRNSRAPVAANPSLVAAGADEAEADPAQRIAARPAVVDTELHRLYGDGVDHVSDLGRPGDAAQGDPQSSVRPGTTEPYYCKCGYTHEDYCGGELCDFRESTRLGRLSRWQEQR